MKKINWTEIAIAAPMVLAFGNLGGAWAILYASLGLTILITVAKLAENKPVAVPVVAPRNPLR